MRPDGPLDPVDIDVGSLVRRTVASLYSHLVTRPTGRAVRMAIEHQLAGAGERALSLVDFSEVQVLDFSCADEVVAKLLIRFADADASPEAFFVFRGVRDGHRGPIEAVLRRQALAAVAETAPGRFELVGSSSEAELGVWGRVEELGAVGCRRARDVFPAPAEREVLATLVRRRLVLELPERGEYRALSTLVPQAG